jgi:hypothetical protein
MNWARLLFGSVLAALGAIFLLEYADVLDASDTIARWWPLAVIGAGIVAYFANPRHWVPPMVITVAGIALLLRTTEVVDTFAVVGPALLVLVGLMIILGRGFGRSQIDTRDRISSFNVFSGSEIASHSDHFQGGSVGALFGGTEIDLRDAKPVEGAELDVFVAFGGAEVKVPQGWQVITHGLPIFGGFDNITTKEQIPPGAPVLDINATVLFGGLEVKH